MKAAVKATKTPSPNQQVVGFIDKFEPKLAKLVKSARAEIKRRFPTAIELVYDNYNALAIGYSTTERTSDVIFSLAVYARGLNLYFLYGRSLADPKGILQGSGNQGAFVRVDRLTVFDDPDVDALINQAVAKTKPPLAKQGGGYTIVKSISPKQRPRRPPAKATKTGTASSRRVLS
jgi:hypothetical protein